MMQEPYVPIEGMKTVPACMPVAAGAWYGCLVWCASQEECVRRFKQDTGMDFGKLFSRTPLDAMIDQATGFERDVVIAWADWVTKNVWGEE